MTAFEDNINMALSDLKDIARKLKRQRDKDDEEIDQLKLCCEKLSKSVKSRYVGQVQ